MCNMRRAAAADGAAAAATMSGRVVLAGGGGDLAEYAADLRDRRAAGAGGPRAARPAVMAMP